MIDSDVHPPHGVFARGWRSHPTSQVVYWTTSDRPDDASSHYSLSFDASVVPPLMRDLPKFGHVSTDAVYRADSDCTCSYCNHMFKQTFKPLKKYLYSQMWLMCLLNQVQAMTGMRTLLKQKQSNQEAAIGVQVLNISAKEVRRKRDFFLPEH